MYQRKLNQVNLPFAFLINCCDDAVKDLYRVKKYFISVDIYSDYSQVVAEEEACEILAFFTPCGNWRWKVMPMGDQNDDSKFVSTVTNLQKEWDTLAKESGLKTSYQKSLLMRCYYTEAHKIISQHNLEQSWTS